MVLFIVRGWDLGTRLFTFVPSEIVCTPQGICTHKICTLHGNLHPFWKFVQQNMVVSYDLS